LIAFAFAYIAWRLGAWAGGDVKLFTGIAALVPMPYAGAPAFYSALPLFPFLVLVNSVIIAFPFLMVYVFWKTLAEKRLHAHAVRMLRNTAGKAAFLALASFGSYGIVSWLHVSALAALIPLIGLAFVPHRLVASLALSIIAFALTGDASALLPLAAGSLAVTAFFEAVTYGTRHALRKSVPIALAEGQIAAVTMYADHGKVREYSPSLMQILSSGFSLPQHTLVSSYNAAGVTHEEVVALRKHNVKTLEIKESVPMVPILLLGLAASVVGGDLVWLAARLL
jgi:preflagellin peptidase FlaK